MTKDPIEIFNQLKSIFESVTPPLKVKEEKEGHFELMGTKEVMQGKQKVKGFYFGTIMQKPKDARLYFFPIYTHVSEFEWISPELRKCLKGKSCFHVKKMDQTLKDEIQSLVHKGLELYQKDDLI